MRTPAELLQQIAQRLAPRPFQCDSGTVVLPDGRCIRGRECMSAIAIDSKPAPQEPTMQTIGWMTVIQPNADAMREASARADCFEGVSYPEGQRRLAAYLERHEGGRNA